MKLIAYLDPGTGALIVQAVVGGVAGVAVLVKAKGRRMLKKQEKGAGATAEDTPVIESTHEAASDG